MRWFHWHMHICNPEGEGNGSCRVLRSLKRWREPRQGVSLDLPFSLYRTSARGSLYTRPNEPNQLVPVSCYYSPTTKEIRDSGKFTISLSFRLILILLDSLPRLRQHCCFFSVLLFYFYFFARR